MQNGEVLFRTVSFVGSWTCSQETEAGSLVEFKIQNNNKNKKHIFFANKIKRVFENFTVDAVWTEGQVNC